MSQKLETKLEQAPQGQSASSIAPVSEAQTSQLAKTGRVSSPPATNAKSRRKAARQSKQPKTESVVEGATVHSGHRMNIHTVILAVLSAHPDATPEMVEKYGQQLKVMSKGRYSRVASREYVTDEKTGIVSPRLSDAGLEAACSFWNSQERWCVGPQEVARAKKYAESHSIKLVNGGNRKD